MSAQTFTFDHGGVPLELPRGGPLLTAARKLGWLGITGLTVTAGAVFGMAVAVVAAVGTVVVAAIALACVVAIAAVLAAGLLVLAVVLVAAGALALTLGVVAGTLASICGLSAWLGRGLGALFSRFGALRARRVSLLQPSKSSSS